MAPRYRVTLSAEEREELEQISTTGIRSAKTILHARALLLLDAGEHGPRWNVSAVSDAIGLSTRSLEHMKARFVEEGMDEALYRKQRETPPRPLQFGGEFEARLIKLACSEAPEGRKRWTIRLLAEQLVELDIVPSVSPMTVCNTLKKTNFVLTSKNTGRSHRIRAQRS